MLGITLKIGSMIIPLNMCIVSKQGRGNTDKLSCFVAMLKAVLDFFDTSGVDLRKYPITLIRGMAVKISLKVCLIWVLITYSSTEKATM